MSQQEEGQQEPHLKCFLNPKFFRTQIFAGRQIFLEHKIFGTQHFLVQKVLYPKFCGPKFFRDPNIFWNPTYPTHINPTNHSKSTQPDQLDQHGQPNRLT